MVDIPHSESSSLGESRMYAYEWLTQLILETTGTETPTYEDVLPFDSSVLLYEFKGVGKGVFLVEKVM